MGEVRVVVDGWELAPAAARRGIGRFLACLLPLLAARLDGAVVVLQRAEEPPSALPAGVERAPVARRAPRGRVRLAEIEHLLRLPLDLRGGQPSVVLSPGTLPPLATPGPWVQTLHDLAPLALADRTYRWARVRWRAVGWRLRRADRIVAVSRFAADEGIRILGLDPARIEVVHHGTPPGFAPSGTVRDEPAPYVAAVVHADPRKGLAEALQVARQLAGSDHRLLLAGPLPAAARASIDAELPAARTLGFVEDLPALLRGADVALVPSRYEGFGFNALEAMACGTPLVAFDTTAVAEVVGDAAVLVDGDGRALGAAVRRLLGDPDARADLRERGLARAAGFDWGTAADRYATLLRRLG